MTIATALRGLSALAAAVVLIALAPAGGRAEVTAFRQAVAETVSGSDALSRFYRETGFDALWTTPDAEGAARRAALIAALRRADLHGLPPARYDVEGLVARMRDARSQRDLGLVEGALSRAYLAYARDVQGGLLRPSRIDPGIVRSVPHRDGADHLRAMAAGRPEEVLRALPPAHPQYRLLMKERLRLAALVAAGGWGPAVASGTLEPGDTGPAVIRLRNRLVAMGYLARTAAPGYDRALETAVRAFQKAHGLAEDGVAGPGTLEQIDIPAEERLKSVLVALERERWLNIDRGARHILVNQTDFTARIVDHGAVTFETRSVIGKNTEDRRSPEFSDVMEHMVINPSWHVPRSIMTGEYLPQLQRNPNAADHLIITDRRGRRIDRSAVDFTRFSKGHFPFDMRQPPGDRNALGLVKFMFPNPYNIYLHDTPQKELFDRETRAFSHGCIRLADPFGFAYALLARQEEDPQAFFQRILATGRETRVELEQPVPVHLIYRTAIAREGGGLEFRRDVYGRDALIWEALTREGVALDDLSG